MRQHFVSSLEYCREDWFQICSLAAKMMIEGNGEVPVKSAMQEAVRAIAK